MKYPTWLNELLRLVNRLIPDAVGDLAEMDETDAHGLYVYLKRVEGERGSV